MTALASTLSPGILDTTQTSRGKTNHLHRTPAGSTTPGLDGYGLRDHLSARVGLVSGSCPSGRGFAPRLPLRPRLAATPLRFANPSPPSGWIEDLHLQAVSHARHTKRSRTEGQEWQNSLLHGPSRSPSRACTATAAATGCISASPTRTRSPGRSAPPSAASAANWGSGPTPRVPLARARLRATELRLAISKGRNPLAAERVHAISYPRWRSQKHADDWWATLERHAFPELGDLPVDRIDRFAVLNVLTPIWTKTPETARRVRQRIRAVMRWATAHGHIDDNPAGEVIDGALPAMPKIKAHLRALPYGEVPDALLLVAASRASTAAKACFRFLVLTAARSGQARGATWAEIDRTARE